MLHILNIDDQNDMDISGLVWICDVCILNKCYANGVHVIHMYIYIYVILIGYAHIICDVFVSSFLRFLVSFSVVSLFPRFFVSSFLRFFVSWFPRFFVSSFLCFLVSSFLRFFVSSFLHFFVSLFPRFFVSSFPRFFVFLCFLVSSFPRFFVSLFPRFFVSSFPRAHWRAPGPRLEVQFPCVFSWFCFFF